MSGCTTPVTFRAGTALYSTAVTSGNWSGWSTLKLLASRSDSTVAFGGASAAGSALLLQPESVSDNAQQRAREKARLSRPFVTCKVVEPYSTGQPRAAVLTQTFPKRFLIE